MIDQVGDFLANARNIYLVIAVAGSVFFVIQLILALIGMGGDGGLNADIPYDVDGDIPSGMDGFHVFTLRGIAAFLTFFGWSGFFWGYLGWGGFFISFAIGSITMLLSAVLVFLLLKFRQSGNISAESLVGSQGMVYLTIPPDRSGRGQVNLALPNCTRLVSAMADRELKTGTPVKVTALLDKSLFLVEEIV